MNMGLAKEPTHNALRAKMPRNRSPPGVLKLLMEVFRTSKGLHARLKKKFGRDKIKFIAAREVFGLRKAFGSLSGMCLIQTLCYSAALENDFPNWWSGPSPNQKFSLRLVFWRDVAHVKDRVCPKALRLVPPYRGGIRVKAHQVGLESTEAQSKRTGSIGTTRFGQTHFQQRHHRFAGTLLMAQHPRPRQKGSDSSLSAPDKSHRVVTMSLGRSAGCNTIVGFGHKMASLVQSFSCVTSRYLFDLVSAVGDAPSKACQRNGDVAVGSGFVQIEWYQSNDPSQSKAENPNGDRG
ncbi:hypothetical protein BKA70DRAFT_1228131 [Coprinopsis sp. MPI-PUGE-AT-0042]|nr:hypothetical protein BKA70DRAFT_1228131 [Coprinopsis sp. MPI-PUGE-AT-0042]